MSDKPLFDGLFLGVGAMKAGTTWLYAVLDRHPELHFTYEKEIHYFHHAYLGSDVLREQRRLENARNKYAIINPAVGRAAGARNRLRWTANYLDNPVDDIWYRNLFVYRHTEPYCCDFSNLYALLDEAAWRRVVAIAERLRVLYTLRDPVKRLWSHIKFHLQVTGELARLEEWKADEFRRFAHRQFIWENAEYGLALRRMKAVLPPSSLKVVFFEDIHQDPRAFLAGVEDFLGIRRFNYPDQVISARVNESVSHPMPDFFPDLFQADFKRIVSEVRAAGFQPPASWAQY